MKGARFGRWNRDGLLDMKGKLCAWFDKEREIVIVPD
jgi:hypothetical protein